MASTNGTSIMVIPDPDEFLRIIADLQDQYLKQHGQTGCDEDE